MTLKPYKVENKHEEIILYSHLDKDYLTVEVDCEFKVHFFYLPEFERKYDNYLMKKEVNQFMIENKLREGKIKDLLQKN